MLTNRTYRQQDPTYALNAGYHAIFPTNSGASHLFRCKHINVAQTPSLLSGTSYRQNRILFLGVNFR
jgi:hypothetical protein